MVCLLRLAALKTEWFCLNYIKKIGYILLILLLLSVFVFLSLIDLYFLLFSRSPNSYEVELYILVPITWRPTWIIFSINTETSETCGLVGLLKLFILDNDIQKAHDPFLLWKWEIGKPKWGGCFISKRKVGEPQLPLQC